MRASIIEASKSMGSAGSEEDGKEKCTERVDDEVSRQLLFACVCFLVGTPLMYVLCWNTDGVHSPAQHYVYPVFVFVCCCGMFILDIVVSASVLLSIFL